MAVSIGTNSNANDWGHFEYSGIGQLGSGGQTQNLSGNDLRFVLNSSTQIAKDQTVTIDKALIITAQDANASVSSWLSPAYVTINLKGVEENHAPTITNATATSPTEIKVEWHNPQYYPGGVGIYKKLNSEINWPEQPAKFFPSSTSEAHIGNHTVTITDLTPNTSYNIKVRGWLKEQ